MIAAPLFHSWGFAHFTLAMGLCTTIVLQRKFDPEATLSLHRAARVHGARRRAGDAPAHPRARRRGAAAATTCRASARCRCPAPRCRARCRERWMDLLRGEPLQPLRLDRGGVGDDRDAGGPARRAGHGRPAAARHDRCGLRRRRQRGRARGRRGASSSATSSRSRATRAAAARTRSTGCCRSGDVGHFDAGGAPVHRRPRRRHDRLGRRERVSRRGRGPARRATRRSPRRPSSASTDEQFGQRLKAVVVRARGQAS